jgi:hypothetical protein
MSFWSLFSALDAYSLQYFADTSYITMVKVVVTEGLLRRRREERESFLDGAGPNWTFRQ